MSLNTWKVEFYPMSADTVAKNCNELECVNHCIQKWSGLNESNLVKHGLDPHLPGFGYCRETSTDDFPGYTPTFSVSDETCALCVLDDIRDSGCMECVLSKQGFMCNMSDSPFDIWTRTSDTGPMLAALNQCKDALTEK